MPFFVSFVPSCDFYQVPVPLVSKLQLGNGIVFEAPASFSGSPDKAPGHFIHRALCSRIRAPYREAGASGTSALQGWSLVTRAKNESQ